MRNFALILSLLLGYIGSGYCQDVVFYNINIVDVENGEIIPEMTVTINNGRIVDICKAKERIEQGQEDCTGNYLMPGLIDSHVHWASYAQIPENLLGLTNAYLKEGITTVREMGGDLRLVEKYQNDLKKGDIVGPTVYTASYWAGKGYRENRVLFAADCEGGVAPWDQEVSDTMSVATIEKMVVEAKKYGCTGLKLYHSISYETLKKIVEACQRHDVKPWGHFTIFPATAMDVVKSGVQTVSHTYLISGLEGFNRSYKTKRFTEEEIAKRSEIFKEMAKRGTILDATVSICIGNGSAEEAFRYTNEAYKAGVTIAAGTDWAHLERGIIRSAFLEELQLLADSCGMSIPDVLRAATIVGAEIIGQSGNLGVIKEGAEADLLVLSENPLESLEALKKRKALYIDGKKVTGINKGFGIGKPSPLFTYPDINGNKVSLKDFHGKYVFIDIWASWCGPCRAQIPALKKLEEELKGKNIVFISISCDKNAKDWKQAVAEEKLEGIILHTAGDNSFLEAYGIKSIPRFILLDKEGNILDDSMTYPTDPVTGETLRTLEGL